METLTACDGFSTSQTENSDHNPGKVKENLWTLRKYLLLNSLMAKLCSLNGVEEEKNPLLSRSNKVAGFWGSHKDKSIKINEKQIRDKILYCKDKP